MIVIYTQDETFIRKDAAAAKSILSSVYGEKLGAEAYMTIKNAREGTSFQKFGGPLIRVVTKEEATVISEKEKAIGMLF